MMASTAGEGEPELEAERAAEAEGGHVRSPIGRRGPMS